MRGTAGDVVSRDEELLTLRTLGNQEWRLNHLYTIKNERGLAVRFRLNTAQAKFFPSIWYFNVILKARQLGFSTFISIYMLDACLFNDNHKCGIIDISLSDAKNKLDKAKFAYEKIPEDIKVFLPKPVKWGSEEISFDNGSSIVVGTSHRGDTLQKLHVSELGKIAAKYPERAKEIRTGAYNAVHAGQQVFVESTAEGQGGEFFDLCQKAQQLAERNAELTTLDPKFHFYPWWQDTRYSLPDEECKKVFIATEDERYFTELASRGITLTHGQKCWYVKKADQQGDEMKREFPSYPEEAFEAAVEGAYYSRQLGIIRRNGHVCELPHRPEHRVYTFWDLGINDMMSIWFMQQVGERYHFINYFEDHNEGIQYYIDRLMDMAKKLGYSYGGHYWPHDGAKRDPVTAQPLHKTAKKLGLSPLFVVNRTPSLKEDIQLVRNKLPQCSFDAGNCAKGLSHLGNYRKEWDDNLGVWKDRPRHDDASHGEAAFRTFVRGFRSEPHRPGVAERYGRNMPSAPMDIMDI